MHYEIRNDRNPLDITGWVNSVNVSGANDPVVIHVNWIIVLVDGSEETIHSVYGGSAGMFCAAYVCEALNKGLSTNNFNPFYKPGHDYIYQCVSGM